jgi:hypothetical protein
MLTGTRFSDSRCSRGRRCRSRSAIPNESNVEKGSFKTGHSNPSALALKHRCPLIRISFERVPKSDLVDDRMHDRR